MNPYIDLKKGVFPVSEFRANTSNMIKETKKQHRPTLLTEYGKSSAVLVGSEDYQNLIDRMELNENFIKGLEDYDAGRTLTSKQARKVLLKEFK
jgi:prevent-host-death family protein